MTRLQKALRAMENFRDDAFSTRQRLKQAQETLTASRDLYAELYDYAPIGYVTVNLSGVIENANHTAASLMRTERGQLIGHPFLNWVAQPDWTEYARHRSVAATGAQVRTELNLQPHDGPAVPVQISTRESLLAGVGNRRVFLTTILNLSEIRRNEAERLRLATEQQKAQLASEAKDRFLAVLSHELRTPLTPILAAVSDPELPNVVPSPLRETLEMIRRNIGIEVQLVEDLLDVSRVTQGKLRLAMQPTDLHQIIRETVELLTAEARAARIELLRDLRADDHWVHGDPIRLRQVLWNLVRNAIKFTPAGGRILIRAISSAVHDKRITVSVRDSGIGIEPDQLEKLFSPFEQINPTVGGGGLGLGLTICRGLVAAHEGEIVAHSEGRGSGSTFEFTLATIATPAQQPMAPTESPLKPASVGREQPPPPPLAHSGEPGRAASPTQPPLLPPSARESKRNGEAQAQQARRSLHIMLVEDHPDTALVMAKLLKRRGHDVEVANNFHDAAALADNRHREQPFDLAISDISLPDGSGLDLMRRLRAAGQSTRGIALSGLASEADVQRAREAGFDEHLAKPINFDQLLTVINALA